MEVSDRSDPCSTQRLGWKRKCGWFLRLAINTPLQHTPKPEAKGYKSWDSFHSWRCRGIADWVCDIGVCCDFLHLGYLLYRGNYTTQLYGDYFINHDIRIPIKKPGFNRTFVFLLHRTLGKGSNLSSTCFRGVAQPPPRSGLNKNMVHSSKLTYHTCYKRELSICHVRLPEGT